MINAIALDDEPKALEIIKNHAARVPFLSLRETFTNPLPAFQFIENNGIQLIFLDIKMPELSGIDFAHALADKKIHIILTTGFSEYALQGYAVEAVDFLLKPFEFEKFLKSVLRVEQKIKDQTIQHQYFFVNTGNEQRKIWFNEIRYIEGNGNYVNYFINNEKIMVRSTLKETMQVLPLNQFIQIHRSCIISLAKLDKVQDNHAYVDDTKIPISASYREDLMKFIRHYSA